MRRREFIGRLIGTAVAWPHVVMAQSAAKRPLVAVLLATSSTGAARYVSHFPQGLRELGYVEGQNIEIVYRYADGDLTRLPTLADELVRLNPDVIVTAGSAVPAIKRSTATIPIVGVAMTDPVGFGFATSIAHPGGQVTGIICSCISEQHRRKACAVNSILEQKGCRQMIAAAPYIRSSSALAGCWHTGGT
jgi:putative ABC transport system substrate-binding protein